MTGFVQMGHIWKSSGRPVSGVIYDCYKNSKKTYRQCWRSAIHSNSNQKTKLISKLYNNHKQAKVWNLIRQSKKRKPSENVIGVPNLWIIMLINLMAVIIALNILSLPVKTYIISIWNYIICQ